MIYPNSPEAKTNEEAEELTGNMAPNEDTGLMNSVIEAKEKTKEGKLIKEALNKGISSFVPDSIYENLVNNYSYAKKLYGKTFVNLISGYDADYVGKNVKIPEFQRELKKKIQENIQGMKESGLIDEENRFKEKGINYAAISLYLEELDKLEKKGLMGEKVTKRRGLQGTKNDTKNYKKGDRYQSIAIRKTIKKAIRRQHSNINLKDVQTFEYAHHGRMSIIYGLDASGSMKGDKIDLAKKAGIALAYKAIQQKDKVGLIVFSQKVKEEIEPTHDFTRLVKVITRVKPSHQTNIQKMVSKAKTMFKEGNKHLMIITDALPTIGSENEILEEISRARSEEITTSLIGVNLDKKGEELAKKIIEIGEGNLYIVKNPEELDTIVLEDYYNLR